MNPNSLSMWTDPSSKFDFFPSVKKHEQIYYRRHQHGE